MVDEGRHLIAFGRFAGLELRGGAHRASLTGAAPPFTGVERRAALTTCP